MKDAQLFIGITLTLACCGQSLAQQSDEEMLAEAQKRLNAQVFGLQQKPARPEWQLYIENASANRVTPRTTPPNYWQNHFTCEDIQQRSHQDFLDCHYYYHVNGRYWTLQEMVVNSSPPTVVKRASRTVTIDQFDEDALEDYYEGLKAVIQFLGPISSVSSENLEAMKSKSGFGSLTSLWNMLIAKMDSAKIELDEWPAEAKQKGWDILGKRITKYNKMFEQQRDRALKNDALDQDIKDQIEQFELLTESSL